MKQAAVVSVGIVSVLFLVGMPEIAVAQSTPAVEIAGGYQINWDNDVDGSFPTGWFVSGAGFLTDNLAIVGEVSGSYKSESDGFFTADLDLHTYLAGARFSSRAGAVTPFGQVLVGAAKASGRLGGFVGFEERASETAFAAQPGGGVDIHLTEAIAARVMFDYRRIFFEGEANDEIRVAAGIVFGFGSQ